MGKIIDADVLCEKLLQLIGTAAFDGETYIDPRNVKFAIDLPPEYETSTQADPDVVRCKDCIHGRDFNAKEPYCDLFSYTHNEYPMFVEADHYCSCGKRRKAK
jgi:hypothetical protein